MASRNRAARPPAAAPTSAPSPAPEPVKRDPRTRVRVFNKITGAKLPAPVPVSWLDGRFPHLTETPSSRQEGN